ncbi:MAG: cytochrome c3 family protein [Burkholderiales bacterium]
MGLAAGALIVPTYAVILFAYGASPRALDAGYQPLQPVPYSHALHAGKLGLDCRYCHINVEYAAHAMIPPTQTCINCHHAILPASAKLVKIKESWETGKPVEWVRVHDLPDFVYFDHSAHVRRGVGCVSCHGRIDRMEVVYQHEPLSMGWCLDCHREPEKHLRPLDKITDMAWQPPEDALVFGKRLREAHSINPSTDCSTCHR